MFKMAQSNHRGSSATGKRGRIEGEQWGKTSVMRLKQNAKTNRRGRAEKDRERERFWRSLIPAVHSFSPTLLLVFLLLLTHSISLICTSGTNKGDNYSQCECQEIIFDLFF